MYRILVGVVFVFLAVVGTYVYRQNEVKPEARNSTPDPVEKILKNMSIEEKIAQMFMIGIFQPKWEEIAKKAILEKRIGGVLITGSNVKESPDIKSAITGLQSQVMRVNQPKLFISVDQEGGTVSRLVGDNYIRTAQSEIKNYDEAYQVAFKRGQELVSLGININFSPVLEYITDQKSFLYPRGFRGTKDLVIDLGIGMVRGYGDGGIISTVKHFPGHIDDSVDSHKKLPVVYVEDKDFDEYIRTFKEVIMKENPPMIMSAHVLIPSIDSNYPATLSNKVIGEILRGEFGYKGVVVTDDLEMGAIKSGFGLEEIVLRAVEAGNDILLFTSTIERQDQAYNLLLEAIRDSRVSEKRIDESVRRILRLKGEFTLLSSYNPLILAII